MGKIPNSTILCLLTVVALLACSDEVELVDGTAHDSENAVALSGGKADGLYSECELAQAITFCNDPSTDKAALKAAGVHTRAAHNIAAYKNGPDETPGTTDDQLFDSPAELDDVFYVGPVAFQSLVDHVGPLCADSAGPSTEVIFSPQPYETSHLVKSQALIDDAQLSLDIAMYSFRDTKILDAIERAISRGVSVRVIFESARDHKNDPEGTMSAKLEDLGADVRYINKIMHHKFAIIDGPRSSISQAATGTLITGSANWSHSAATRYDENTVVLKGHKEALTKFQKEFNLLWNYSRDLVWNTELVWFSSLNIDTESTTDDPSFDAAFTSDNFAITHSSTYGPTFSVQSGLNTVADRLVSLIESAQQSIYIASGHLRSRPISQALMARKEADPTLDIRVYLDGQEFLSKSSHSKQSGKVDQCLEAAGDSVSKQQSCLDKGFLFSYAVHKVGIDLRFKYYAYRWHYSYAPQMHHKYVIIDGQTVASGSYNLSDNAEHNTMENLVIYSAESFPELVDAFVANFESMWLTGEADEALDTLVNEIAHGTESSFPIVFDAMALTWDKVSELKQLIRIHCPQIHSEDFRKNPHDHWYCDRQ